MINIVATIKPMTDKRLEEIEALVKMPCDGSRLYEHIAANRDLVAECKRLRKEIARLELASDTTGPYSVD